MFADRADAGRQLAGALAGFRDAGPVILALPRGGVPVGFEVARALAAPLDLLLVRKIGAPHHAELGIGAVVDGEPPEVVLDQELLRLVAPKPGYVEARTALELAEIRRRRIAYLGGRPPPALAGRGIIIVDDGIATGNTARAALRALRRHGPARLVLAVPVAPSEAVASLAREADEVICLRQPADFRAVGAHYQDFTQTTDEEVIALLSAAGSL
jgi:putative phosphoribosyl transferase